MNFAATTSNLPFVVLCRITSIFLPSPLWLLSWRFTAPHFTCFSSYPLHLTRFVFVLVPVHYRPGKSLFYRKPFNVSQYLKNSSSSRSRYDKYCHHYFSLGLQLGSFSKFLKSLVQSSQENNVNHELSDYSEKKVLPKS